LGHYVLKGDFLRLPENGIAGLNLGDQLSAFVVGSIILGVLLGGMAACAAFLVISLRSPENADSRRRLGKWIRFVESLFKHMPYYSRRFVTWKMRLDKIFSILLSEDLGRGRAIDLGCGYGMALALVEYRQPGRRLIGCDLDEERVRIAGEALSRLNAELSVCDVRDFVLPEAGLIMIIDVLQYLDPDEQRNLLSRCCKALVPGGKLVFRVHDRERGLVSKLTKALDTIIFRLSREAKRPTTLPADAYLRAVANDGMIVTKQHFVNRLPLAHILVTAEKPGENPATDSRVGTDAPARVG
jgi:SAM-dependent methyltransferase